jgi:hypothetical protein
MQKMIVSARDIQRKLCYYFDPFRNLVFENVYLGAFELDYAVITPAGYLWEIEIKISISDWRADLKKGKWERYLCADHSHKRPSRFYYAVPHKLVSGGIPGWVPEKAGVISIDSISGEIRSVRPPGILTRDRIAPETINVLLRKTYFRFWQMTYSERDQQTEKTI